MPLVSAKCTSCGATLKVDNTKESAICDYCGAEYIVEKAVNNYNITNNIKADNVNVYVAGKGDAEKERLLANAKTNESYEEYDKAYAIYSEVANDYPNDYRGWYGMAKIKTQNFNNVNLSKHDFDKISKDMEKAIAASAMADAAKEIKKQWNDYSSKYTEFINQKKAEVSTLQTEVQNYEKRISESQKTEDAFSKQYNITHNKLWKTKKSGIGGIFSYLIVVVALPFIVWHFCKEGLNFHNEASRFFAIVFFIPGFILLVLRITKPIRLRKQEELYKNNLHQQNNNTNTMNRELQELKRKMTDIKNTYGV